MQITLWINVFGPRVTNYAASCLFLAPHSYYTLSLFFLLVL